MRVSSFGSSLQDPLKAYHAEVLDTCERIKSYDSKILQVVKKVLIVLIIPIAYFLLAIPYGIGALLKCISPGNFTHTPYMHYNPYHYPAPLPAPLYVPPAVVPLPAPHFFPPPAPAPAAQPYHHPNAPDKNPDAAVVREGRDLELGIEQLKTSGESWWKEAAVNLIRRARLDSHEDEYTRLWCAGLLNPAEDEKIDQVLAKVTTNGLQPRLNESKPKALAVKVLLGQAMEIQRIYKETHHVFIHAQETRWIVFTYLLKEIAKKAAPHVNLQQYKYLRVPSSPSAPSASPAAPNNFFNSYMPQPVVMHNDARKYARQSVVNDGAGTTRDELLSADAYFYNFANCESSLHFLANNSNINQVSSLLRNVVKLGIHYFYPTIPEAALEAYANQVAAIPVQASPCGNLFVICTPKERAEEFHYRAHPFGTPCNCHPAARSPEIIDRLQEGVLDVTTKCVSPSYPNPQFRVYAPLLSPHVENREHKIYLLTPFAKAYRKALKAQVKALATLIHQSVNPAVPRAI